jgi:hypothetical protein
VWPKFSPRCKVGYFVRTDGGGLNLFDRDDEWISFRSQKESNRLEEVEAGLIHSEHGVYTEYTDPKRDEWAVKVLPALKRIPIPELVKETGMSMGGGRVVGLSLRLGCEFPVRSTPLAAAAPNGEGAAPIFQQLSGSQRRFRGESGWPAEFDGATSLTARGLWLAVFFLHSRHSSTDDKPCRFGCSPRSVFRIRKDSEA